MIAPLPTLLLLLLVLLLQLQYIDSNDNSSNNDNNSSNDYCDRSLLSITNIISSCNNGNIGIGINCDCNSNNCNLPFISSYLPLSSLYLNEYRNERKYICDKLLSIEFGQLLLNTSNIIKQQGYPFDRVCQSSDDPNCHTPTIGKYIRYQSLMQFHRFKGYLNNDNDNYHKNDLIDIDFPHGWLWTLVDKCNDIGLAGKWNCIFRSITESIPSSPDKLHKLSHSNLVSWPQISDITLKDMFNIKHNNINNIAQVLMYGKIMDMMSKPTPLVEEFIVRYLSNVNQHLHDKMFPSVSMHVRQGDACDIVTNDVNEKITTATDNNRRKCYSVDAYMSKLYKLKELYGVKRVYLATDSQDMIYRTFAEKDFNWIYINVTRDAFNSRTYVDHRMRQETSFREIALFSAVADLELMRRGDIFLGAFSSHYSKLSYYLMSGSKMRAIPFISVDYTLSCDQLDTCTDETIGKRPHSINDMINWAPECIHNVLDWSPRPGEDPCGIYT